MINRQSQIVELVRLLLRASISLWWIIPLSIALGIVAMVLFPVVKGNTYQNSAIAIIRPQVLPESISARRITNEKGEVEYQEGDMRNLIPLDVSDYRLMISSDAILQQVVDGYNEEFVREDNEEPPMSLELIRRCLFAEERLKLKSPYSVVYYPTLEMRAISNTPEKAYFLLNAWIGAVEIWAHDVIFDAKEEIYDFIDQEFNRARDDLDKVQEEMNTCKAQSEDMKDALMLKQSRELEEYEAETFTKTRETAAEWDIKATEELQNHRLETIRQTTVISNKWDEKITALKIENNLPLHEAEIESFTEDLMGLYNRLTEKQLDLKDAATRLKELEKVRAEEPDFLVLGKAITDDALWQQFTDGLKNPDKLSALSLKSQEINPIALEISSNIAGKKVDVSAVPEQMEDLNQRIGDFTDNVGETQSFVFQKTMEEEVLDREKESAVEGWIAEREVAYDILKLKFEFEKQNALEELKSKREIGLADLKRRHEFDVAKLDRERTALEETLQRDYTAQLGIFDGLMDSRLRASLAKANTIEEFVVLAAPALQPEKEGSIVQRGMVGIAAFIAISALLYSARIGLVLFREIAAIARSQENLPAET